MAETKTEDAAETGDATEAKPRRRITRRKAVEEHARGYFAAISARDPDAMAAHWREDGVADIVPIGILRGRDELAEFFRGLFAAFPDLETTVERVVAGEREAAVEWRMTGHFTGTQFDGVDPTGRRIELRGSDHVEIDDGEITAITAYFDGMGFARQIGLMPPRESSAEKAVKGAFNAATKVRRAIAERRAGE
jgi:steroid delta-isomerase-like uncharacterized protein